MIQPDFNRVFFLVRRRGGGGGGWEGGVFVVTSAFKSFILKLDMGKSIFLNIFVQYCTLCTVQSKRKIFLSTCPSDKHYIKFGCPIPKRSYPKRFARFLSQMELVKTNEMVAV